MNQATCIFLVALASLPCKYMSVTECLTICRVLFAGPSSGNASTRLHCACLWDYAKPTCQQSVKCSCVHNIC